MVDGRVVNYMRPTTTCRASQVWSTRSTVDELLIDLAWRNFPRDKVRDGSALISGDKRIPLQDSGRRVEGSLCT